MGADLYIDAVYKTNRKKPSRNFNRWVKKRDLATDPVRKDFCQKKVSEYHEKMFERGYFRDSYNGTSLFARLGLSWWQDFCPDIPDGLLSVTKAKEWRERVASLPLKPCTFSELRERWCECKNDDDVDEWNKYFVNKKQEFLDFLDEAIRLNTPVRCSC